MVGSTTAAKFPISTNGPETESVRESRKNVPDSLRERHQRYWNDNQNEPYTQPLYVENGHPDATAYRRERAFFEQLRWAANSSARFYSFTTHQDSTSFWSPHLGVKHLPAMTPPRDRDGHTQLIEQVELTAENTYLSHGTWVITTTDQSFFEAVRDLARSCERNLTGIHVPSDYSEQRPGWETADHFSARFPAGSVREVQAAKELIDEWVSPLVTATIPDANEV
jgi:hypothetical protein